MRFGLVIGIICAVLLHVGFILFGGALFADPRENHGTTQEVELLTDVTADDQEKETPTELPPEELQTESEEPPDSAEILRALEESPNNDAPELEAASLSAIEAALSGQGGFGGDFAQSMSFESGGRIGGTGKAGGMEDELERAFSLSEIDQRPRAIHQVAPNYPSVLRGKSIEGVVTVICIVDASGRVSNPRVESSNNAAFEKPAVDALKRWKFEPAVKGGERVSCKIRQPIRFPPG
jgi:protein TonB